MPAAVIGDAVAEPVGATGGATLVVEGPFGVVVDVALADATRAWRRPSPQRSEPAARTEPTGSRLGGQLGGHGRGHGP